MVPTTGIEPVTFWLQVSCTTSCAKSAYGRNDRIWTCAPLFPKQVLCQAKLHSEILAGILGFEPRKCQIQSLVPYRLATSQQKHGGLRRTRTFDKTVNSRLLYPLSYKSVNAQHLQIRWKAGCSPRFILCKCCVVNLLKKIVKKKNNDINAITKREVVGSCFLPRAFSPQGGAGSPSNTYKIRKTRCMSMIMRWCTNTLAHITL